MSSTHSYYEWQISTLMLAYDAVDPIPRNEEKRIATRQMEVEEEVHRLAHSVIPQAYRENPQLDFPAPIVVLLTHATVKRAAEILGFIPSSGKNE